MTHKNFEATFMIGGHANSLGKTEEVVQQVLADESLLEELYRCMFSQDAWVRMRAADAFEKVCREHSEWIERYVDRIQRELYDDAQQASIKWHIAQIYQQVSLTPKQKKAAIHWLIAQVSTVDVDWIVSANVMETLVYFVKSGDIAKDDVHRLLKIQTCHTSNAVTKKANKLIAILEQSRK